MFRLLFPGPSVRWDGWVGTRIVVDTRSFVVYESKNKKNAKIARDDIPANNQVHVSAVDLT